MCGIRTTGLQRMQAAGKEVGGVQQVIVEVVVDELLQLRRGDAGVR